MWFFHFHPTKRCVNLNFIDKTDGTVAEEDEFLFPPFSTFTVKSVKFVGTGSYHEIHLEVAKDNMKEPNDLPLAPWA